MLSRGIVRSIVSALVILAVAGLQPTPGQADGGHIIRKVQGGTNTLKIFVNAQYDSVGAKKYGSAWGMANCAPYATEFQVIMPVSNMTSTTAYVGNLRMRRVATSQTWYQQTVQTAYYPTNGGSFMAGPGLNGGRTFRAGYNDYYDWSFNRYIMLTTDSYRMDYRFSVYSASDSANVDCWVAISPMSVYKMVGV